LGAFGTGSVGFTPVASSTHFFAVDSEISFSAAIIASFFSPFAASAITRDFVSGGIALRAIILSPF
jgi:hypothetical protein